MTEFVAVGSLTRPAPQYPAAEGAGVSLFRFDDATGQLTPSGAPLRLEDSSWIAAEPGRSRLFVVTDCEDGESALASVAIDPEAGALSLISKCPAGGNEGCHAVVSKDGRRAVVANYCGFRADGPQAGVAVFDVADGVLAEGPGLHRHEGSGPNAERQDRPHSHCAALSPDERFLFVADLGIDRLVAYEMGEGATRRPDLDVTLPPGTGPRHLLFTPDAARVHVVNELIGGVTTFAYDAGTGAMTPLGVESLVPESGAAVQPAGLILHPDGRHLLASVRLTDEIVVLDTAGEDRIARVAGRYPSGGATPRDLALSPSGRHLLVANQDSGRITVWALSDARPGPAPVCDLAIGTPMAVAFA